MSDRREVVGAVVLYETPDALVEGIAKAQEAGLRRLDVISPYPIHGIDTLLGRRPSRLGYIALAAGLLGTALAKGAQWWTSAVDYPLNIGGKPLFSWPAFIPVTFELMVLFTSLTVFIGMLAVFNRLPHYGSALHRSEAIRRLTCDTFGLVIDAKDPAFDAQKIGEVFGADGALGVEMLYRERADGVFGEQVLSLRFLLLLVAVAFLSAAVTRAVFRYGGEVPPFDFMKRQARLNPQTRSTFFPDSLGMRAPVPGTVARGFLPYPYPDAPESAAANLVNPIPLTAENLARGREQYEIFCRPCHGPRGEGNGTLTRAFPKPPSLHSAKVRAWPDGRIYHVITRGQNAMPSYAAQIPRDDRWRIIHFVRALQRSRNAPDRDVQ